MLETGAGGFENGGHVFQNLLCLRFDVRSCHLARSVVHCALARYEQELLVYDSRGIGPSGFGQIVCLDRLMPGTCLHEVSPAVFSFNCSYANSGQMEFARPVYPKRLVYLKAEMCERADLGAAFGRRR
jgi:hypothetical protein